MNNTSKAKAIREAIAKLGNTATFKEIEYFMRKSGIVVTPQQVSNEKRKLRGPYDAADLPVSLIKKVKALVDEVGSIETVRRALDELQSLQRAASD